MRIAISLLVSLAALSSHGPERMDCVPRWSVSDTLPGRDSTRAYVERGVVVQNGADFALLGYPSILYPSVVPPVRKPIAPVAGAARGGDGLFVPVPPPAGADTLFGMRVLSTGREAHVLWAVGQARREGRLLRAADTIYYARWRPSGWSDVTRVWAGEGTYWGHSEHSRLDSAGRGIHLAVPFFSDRGEWGALYLRRIDATWSSRILPLPMIPLYVNVLAAPSGETVIGYVSLAPPLHNAVLARRFTATGQPIAPESRVDPGQRGDAHFLRAIRDPRGRLFLLWVEEPAQDGTDAGSAAGEPAALTGSYSDDGGRTWHVLPPIGAARSWSFDAGIDSHGTLVVIWRSLEGGEETLIAATLDGTQWHPTRLAAVDAATSTLTAPLLSAQPDGRLFATWGYATPSPTSLYLRTAVATYIPCARP